MYLVEILDRNGKACDCLADLYDTHAEACAAGQAELDRIAAWERANRPLSPVLDWASGYRVRKEA